MPKIPLISIFSSQNACTFLNKRVFFLIFPDYKANTSNTDASFLDMQLSISNDIVSTKIYDKRYDLF